jgi:S-adenosylmethionine-diacylglycerol 3-amino-3-carboxypropyl transferase
MLRRRARALRSGIAYTRVFEDGETDRSGLAIGPGTRLLTICSAGDRVLDALVWGASDVIAVDHHPAQLRLTALRIAASSVLDDDELLALFSWGRYPGIGHLYLERLRPILAPVDQVYWDRWIDIFEVGLHQHHALGIALAGAGAVLRLIGGRELRRMVEASPDAPSQGRRYERQLRHRYWNRLTRRILGSELLMQLYTSDAGVRRAMRAERYQDGLERRVSSLVGAVLIREHPLWMPLLGGRPVAGRFEMKSLRPDATPLLRGRLTRVRLIEGSIEDVLAGLPEGSLDSVGLSNVPDWLSPVALDRLWEALARVLASGGRALARSVLRAAPLPRGTVAEELVLDVTQSAALTAGERSGLFASVSLLRRRTRQPDAEPSWSAPLEPGKSAEPQPPPGGPG